MFCQSLKLCQKYILEIGLSKILFRSSIESNPSSSKKYSSSVLRYSYGLILNIMAKVALY